MKVYQPHETKICADCKSKLPATNKFFSTNNRRIDNLETECRVCKNHKRKEKQFESLAPIVSTVSIDNPNKYFIFRPDYTEIQVNILKGDVLASVKPITPFEVRHIKKQLTLQ